MVANWKENPVTEREAMTLFTKTARAKRGSDVHVVICPPIAYLEAIGKNFKALRSKKNLALGAQDVFWKEQGPYTGGEGPLMLRSLGVHYVIVGHSERRKFFRETDAMMNRKVQAALAGGLSVILCVGEPLAVRKKGIVAARQFVRSQLTKDLSGIRVKDKGIKIKDLIVAYEPIWAIGTGKNDTPADAAAMAKFIKKTVSHISYPLFSVLYGGSVNSGNVREYIRSEDIDGALVGGASLDAKEFGAMIGLVAKSKR
jgi:triosephosphate isomerase